jgi:SAM-dependent methyltransferase
MGGAIVREVRYRRIFDPARAAKQATAARFGGVAPTYDTVIPYFATFGTALVEAAAITTGERVVDVACGAGAVLRAAAGAGAHVIGVDLAPQMAARALAEAPATVGDAEHLPVASGCADAVLCGFGVFFFPDPTAAAREVRRVLRDDGRFAASTFAGGHGGFDWSEAVAEEVGGTSGNDSPVRRADGLRAVLEDAGFTRVATTRVEATFDIGDVETYERWYLTHGGVVLLRRLRERPELLARWRQLSAVHLADDQYRLHQGVDLTVAYAS